MLLLRRRRKRKTEPDLCQPSALIQAFLYLFANDAIHTITDTHKRAYTIWAK